MLPAAFSKIHTIDKQDKHFPARGDKCLKVVYVVITVFDQEVVQVVHDVSG